MNFIISILKNRNTLLIAAILFGLTIGDIAHDFKFLTLYILGIVLSFSTSGISASEMKSKKEMFQSMGMGVALNYFLFALVLIPAAYFLSPSDEIFWGFVVIAATPPGVAIIPFSIMLGGNLKKATLATLGGFVASIFLAPIIIKVFTGNENLEFLSLFFGMIKLIVVPMLISRLLILKPFESFTIKYRGKIVNWGFALIIFIAVGINRHVFLSNFDILFRVSLVLFISMFVLGQVYDYILMKLGVNPKDRMTQNLTLVIKSSGFSVVTALQLFGEEGVIPSAVMSVFVLGYLLFLTFKQAMEKKKK
ncbi:MAG: hypothetical protein KAH25_10230 [Bacteroidales bacterium]|nr:hypothetical protein [Bacteroidales bacterium]